MIPLDQGIELDLSLRGLESVVVRRGEAAEMEQERAEVLSISCQQLRLLVSVGRLNSVRGAAEECHLSQAAAVEGLAKLEQQLGVALIHRESSGSYLNLLGRAFELRAKRFLSYLEGDMVGAGALRTSCSRSIATGLSRSQMRAAVAIMEAGCLDSAAERLRLSRGSLQRALRQLENRLQETLYCNTPTGLLVTPAGLALGRRLKLAYKELEYGLLDLSLHAGRAFGELAVGTTPEAGETFIGSVFHDLLSAYPTINIRAVEGGTCELAKRLERGELDLVVGVPSEVASAAPGMEALTDSAYLIVGRRGHPLLTQSNVDLDDLRGFEWVVGDPGTDRRACFERLFENVAPPDARISSCALAMVRSLVANSNRLALMSVHELRQECVLAQIPCGQTLPGQTLGMLTRRDWSPTKVHAYLVELFEARLRHDSAVPNTSASTRREAMASASASRSGAVGHQDEWSMRFVWRPGESASCSGLV